MFKKITMYTIVLYLFLGFALFAEGDSVTVTILQTSDMHGRIYPHDYATDSSDSDAGLAKIQTLVKQERMTAPNALLIDCGDTVQDNSADLFNDLPVHPMVQALNSMKYDVWTLGNHEFNFELSFLEKNIKAFNGEVLSANIYKKGTGERWVSPYKIFDVEGVRVAVVGMIPPRVPVWEASAPSHFAGLEFTEPLAETKKVIQELNGKYDVLVGAFHIGPKGGTGFSGLEKIAESCPEFDVLFGGHDHAKYSKKINGVTIIEPGKYGWALSKVQIEVAKKADGFDVASVTANHMETKKIDMDPGIKDEFAYVHKESVKDANVVVGQITRDFIKRPDYITGEAKVTTLPTSQIKDTAIIDLINDVQMFYTKADVGSAALFNFGSNLKQGDFKKKDVAFIYKYPNTLVGVHISGENLLKYMEWSAGYYNTHKRGDLVVSFNPEIRGYNYDMFSGLNYNIDVTQDVGERVVNVTYKGKPLDLSKTYKLALNNYRFGTLLGLKLVTMDDKYYDSYELMQDSGRIRDLIIKYTVEQKKGSLYPKVDNNWKLVGATYNSPFKQQIFDKVIKGEVSMPKSADGRTTNVESLNFHKLLADGKVEAATYVVQSGDMLSTIAEAYGTTWEELFQCNTFSDAAMISPGQEINVPVQ